MTSTNLKNRRGRIAQSWGTPAAATGKLADLKLREFFLLVAPMLPLFQGLNDFTQVNVRAAAVVGTSSLAFGGNQVMGINYSFHPDVDDFGVQLTILCRGLLEILYKVVMLRYANYFLSLVRKVGSTGSTPWAD